MRPRGHRGGIYPLLRGAMCVIVRDLIVFGVLTDMMRGRPAVYATFASYDEVAHHSGLERADTLEALRKLDQQFGRIERARRYAPRPYEIVVLSDHGQTQGATFKQRNGYGLDELVERSLEQGRGREFAGGDEQSAMVGNAVDEATGRQARRSGPKNDVSDREAVVLGSGNLGLIYLMEEQRRLTLEEIDERHPRAHPGAARAPARRLAARPLGRARRRWSLGPRGTPPPRRGAASRARIRWPRSRRPRRGTSCAPTASSTSRTSWSAASTTPMLDEGCAFEELISFHGGLGGLQTRPFILHPPRAAAPRRADHRRGRGARPAARLAAHASRAMTKRL